ncbi:MAG TPA: FUSC family protein, partial [Opitutus sp.]|nr:FUSC family protein [Opitutus sp.]
LFFAQLMGLDKAYWVTVGRVAVLQGTTLRAVWNRQIQRVVGTAAGMLLTWGLLSLPWGPWSVCALVMALTFIIEMLVVRHYALAALFITPITIILAESPNLGTASEESINALIWARFLDTVLGCAVGFVGGMCLHHPRFREAIGGPLRRCFRFGAKT